MNKDNYIPQPIDTSKVELPDTLNPLVEALAKNVHEVWAQSRISQGWSYGSERNDELKHHRCRTLSGSTGGRQRNHTHHP